MPQLGPTWSDHMTGLTVKRQRAELKKNWNNSSCLAHNIDVLGICFPSLRISKQTSDKTNVTASATKKCFCGSGLLLTQRTTAFSVCLALSSMRNYHWETRQGHGDPPVAIPHDPWPIRPTSTFTFHRISFR